MTREDLRDWVEAHHCKPTNIQGFNQTLDAVRFVNPKTNAYAYILTPIDDRGVADKIVRNVCIQLGIPFPECVAEIKKQDSR